MIEIADKEIQQWAMNVCQGESIKPCVSLSPPDPHKDQTCIHVYLSEILPGHASQLARNGARSVTLNYLICVCATDESTSHRLLGQLLFAAMDEPGYSVCFDRPNAALWQAIGTADRPCFMIQMPLFRPAFEEATRVTQYPTVRATPTTSFSGVVVGPHNIPIPGARVTLNSLGRTTSTDNDGEFHFVCVPLANTEEVLRVEAKGIDVDVKTRPSGRTVAQPIILRLNELED